MNISAYDIGTKCGWAKNYPKPTSGVWDLKPKRLEGPGIRYLRFRNYLRHDLALGAELVVFEEVRNHAGTTAAHVYGGLVATLMALCEEKEVNYVSVPIGTWKKVVLGKGNAKKATVLKYVQDHVNPACTSFDHADALCILQWAEAEYEDPENIFT